MQLLASCVNGGADRLFDTGDVLAHTHTFWGHASERFFQVRVSATGPARVGQPGRRRNRQPDGAALLRRRHDVVCFILSEKK